MPMTKEQAHETASTTCVQLAGGYGALKRMVGAENFTYDDNGALTFKFKMCIRANYCRIELDPSDTYTMTFIRIRKKRNSWEYERKEVERIQGIYNDQLKEVFQDFTGLALSIPRIKGVNA